MSDALTVQTVDRLEEIAVEIETIQGVALLKVGERLMEARGLFKYDREEGGFDGWIASRLNFGRSTAYKLIDVFRAFGGESVHKVDALPKAVLYALASPSTPQPVRDEAIKLAEAGEPVTTETVMDLKRQLVDAKASAKAARAEHKNEQSFALAAKEERDRFRLELDYAKSKLRQQAEEIERLKQDGVIHSYAVDPAPVVAPPAPVTTLTPSKRAVTRTACELIAAALDYDVAEVAGLMREGGHYSIAEELEAVAAQQSVAA